MNLLLSISLVAMLMIQWVPGPPLARAAATGERPAAEALASDNLTASGGNSAGVSAAQTVGACGDLTGDGGLTIGDVVYMLMLAEGPAGPTDAQRAIADLDLDGEVGLSDAVTGLRYITGLEDSITCQPVLTVGTATGAPGEEVTVEVSLDTRGTPVRLVQVNLSYDEAKLTRMVNGTGPAQRGPALPQEWIVTSNAADDGDLRFLAVDIGVGQSVNGVVLTVTFTMPEAVSGGAVSVDVSENVFAADRSDPLPVYVAERTVTIQ